MMALGYLLLLFHLASPGSKPTQHLLIHLCQQLVIVTCLPQARASVIIECQICLSLCQALGIELGKAWT